MNPRKNPQAIWQDMLRKYSLPAKAQSYALKSNPDLGNHPLEMLQHCKRNSYTRLSSYFLLPNTSFPPTFLSAESLSYLCNGSAEDFCDIIRLFAMVSLITYLRNEDQPVSWVDLYMRAKPFVPRRHVKRAVRPANCIRIVPFFP